MVDIGSASVRLMVRGPDTQGGFSLIEYTIPPRTLVAPLHRHTWEDEHSFVLDGRIAVVLGDDIIYLAAGELAVKPRRLWHTVWNPGHTPARVLEVISPGGFEHFFEELAEALHAGDTDCLAPGELGRRYGLDTDYESVAQLCAEHRLRFPQRATGEDA
jgi:mannose-6-phosphate isomerase-like protein (cupin superfamily)